MYWFTPTSPMRSAQITAAPPARIRIGQRRCHSVSGACVRRIDTMSNPSLGRRCVMTSSVTASGKASPMKALSCRMDVLSICSPHATVSLRDGSDMDLFHISPSTVTIAIHFLSANTWMTVTRPQTTGSSPQRFAMDCHSCMSFHRRYTGSHSRASTMISLCG